MILIEAEAKARLTGKENEGHDLLYVLQKTEMLMQLNQRILVH
jgi:hypothetical protein